MGSLWETLTERLREEGIDLKTDIWTRVQETLRRAGVDVDVNVCKEGEGEKEFRGVKVVCVAPNLKDSVQEMGETQRDQVVMVRVDEETLKALDAWVETGAVKSRSEAAALFIREGLKVRAAELDQLRDALREVEQARSKLQKKAAEVFGSKDKASGGPKA